MMISFPNGSRMQIDDILESVEFAPEDPTVVANKGQVLPAIEATQNEGNQYKINTKIYESGRMFYSFQNLFCTILDR